MELFQTDLHYIIQNGKHSLWCNRSNGKLEPKSGEELLNTWNPVCLGLVYGIIGKVKLHPDSEWRLILIRQRSMACQMASAHNIYKINKIAILPLTSTNETPVELDLEPCKKHCGMKGKESHDGNKMSLSGTWNSIKTAAENVKTKKKENKDREKFEKRILEELLKMYNDSDFFYYSDNFDITNSVQRQNSPDYDKSLPLWKRADERFFWNKHMLLELMEDYTPLSDPWLLPVIQGYVQMEHCLMDFEEEFRSTNDLSSSVDRKLQPLGYYISIISRRSRHRAGTRSRKRGLNSSGACANYVETEQIIEFSPHIVSFVQVRGSIPVFWSQSGFKYRPPPRLDKDEDTSHEAFTKHFEEQLGLFNKITVVTLAELAGKEQVLGDAYLMHVLKYNSPEITYVTFDFHEYCRGMRFENVSILTEGIKDIIKDMRYCWVDNKGVICEQRGVLRVNCVDCLDRTNVVMTAVARIVMETQFRKLGLLPPEETLPKSCRLTYQQIWANNGDAISRQYAGTAALKGDYTRTGERKFSGLMKDGMNSANRYYLRFRDAHRQAAIDLTLGQPISESLLVPSVDGDEVDGNDLAEKEENVKMMIEDCKRMLIVEPEHCLGGWALINADPNSGDSDRQDMDMVLMLSQRSVYVGWYDDEEEQVTQYQRIYLEDVDRIEIGMEPAMFKTRFLCLRLVYHYQADEGLFHMFRLPSARLFNNKVVVVQSVDEAKESLRVIAETFKSAQEIMSLTLEIVERQKLERKKHTPHPEVMDIHQQQQENSLSCIRLPRDVSTDLHSSAASREEDNGDTSSLEATDNSREKRNNMPGSHSPQTRSKSPLSFLTNIPKPNLPSFPKSLNPTEIHFPRSTSVNISLQTKNLLRKIKLPRRNDIVGENADGNRSDSEVMKQKLVESGTTVNKLHEESGVNGIVFQSCGLLATSPKQLIQSSINLNTENRKRMSSESGKSPRTSANIQHPQPPQTAYPFDAVRSDTDDSNDIPYERFNSDDVTKNETSTDEIKETTEDVTGSNTEEISTSVEEGMKAKRYETPARVAIRLTQSDDEDGEDDDTDQTVGSEIKFELDNEVENEKGENEEDDGGIDDDDDAEAYYVIENEEVCAILKKCHQLHHPSMKVSLSDSSLSQSATGGQEQAEVGCSGIGVGGGGGGGVDAQDSSLVSRFRMKMASLSKPSPGKFLEPPMHTKSHIRKSQRAMEVFEQLMRDKMPGHECKSRFIFI